MGQSPWAIKCYCFYINKRLLTAVYNKQGAAFCEVLLESTKMRFGRASPDPRAGWGGEPLRRLQRDLAPLNSTSSASKRSG